MNNFPQPSFSKKVSWQMCTGSSAGVQLVLEEGRQWFLVVLWHWDGCRMALSLAPISVCGLVSGHPAPRRSAQPFPASLPSLHRLPTKIHVQMWRGREGTRCEAWGPGGALGGLEGTLPEVTLQLLGFCWAAVRINASRSTPCLEERGVFLVLPWAAAYRTVRCETP